MAGKRSIFEEVSDSTARAAPQGGLIDAGRTGARRGVRTWLWILFALVLAMIAVGGLTRLTDSGLSITEWKPMSGAVPPLSDSDWTAEFTKYKASPEGQIINARMTLEEFKFIFWWEWGHRQLGRLVGLVWAVGYLWFLSMRLIPASRETGFIGFLAKGRMPKGWAGRLALPGLLGGVQGAVGWWMVSSGLTGQMVDVASYRLAFHLGLAFVILGVIAWLALSLSRSEAALLQARRSGEPRLFGMATGLLHLAFLQILLGALVAGIDAGRAFPTWPLMGETFFPADAFYIPEGGAVWRAFFENPGLVQFMHRMVGYLLAAYGLVVWLKARKSVHPTTAGAFGAMALMLAVQVTLGILTVLHAAPLSLALIHQLGAAALFVLILRARHRARYPLVTAIREQQA